MSSRQHIWSQRCDTGNRTPGRPARPPASPAKLSPAWPKIAAAGFLFTLLALGGCAQSPEQVAAPGHGKEYFPSSVYGPASRRVIADGQPVPHGGGQYLVGKPYTIAGQTYYPSERKITQVGLASWYGDAFHGRLTANGEVYDRDGFTAAHPTMPLPSYARVTNLRNHYSMIVRVNDRGPYHSNRIMDVSRRVAESLDFRRGGTSDVKVEYVGRASLTGSDDTTLYATLRTDGPAHLPGGTLVAEAPQQAHVASLAHDAPAARSEPPQAMPSDRDGSLPHDARRTPLDGAGEHASHRGGSPARIAAAGRMALRSPPRIDRQAEAQLARLAAQVQGRGPERPAASRLLPAARPARVAALIPPNRRAATGLRLTRSRDD